MEDDKKFLYLNWNLKCWVYYCT